MYDREPIKLAALALLIWLSTKTPVAVTVAMAILHASRYGLSSQRE